MFLTSVICLRAMIFKLKKQVAKDRDSIRFPLPFFFYKEIFPETTNTKQLEMFDLSKEGLGGWA